MAALTTDYTHLENLGEGTYGVVTKAKAKKHGGRTVALKRIKVKDAHNGISFTALREIRVLRDTKHENLVELFDVHTDGNTVVLALEYCVTDLETIVKDDSIDLPPQNVKCYMQMLLSGVAFLHSRWVLHRDLKPNNLLLNANGILKIADFGFARSFGSPDRLMTIRAVTIYYRCPELLFCVRKYGAAVDMWSVGCIFGELMLRRPYLRGASLKEMDQIDAIFKNRGTPTISDWPGIMDLGDQKDLMLSWKRHEKTPFNTDDASATEVSIDLLNRLLDYNPAKRISAEHALTHHYFHDGAPPPADPSEMPLPVPFELRGKPKEKKADESDDGKKKKFGTAARSLGF